MLPSMPILNDPLKNIIINSKHTFLLDDMIIFFLYLILFYFSPPHIVYIVVETIGYVQMVKFKINKLK
jgi:hypothetical protein